MARLFQKHFQDEDVAREFLEKLLWPSGPVSPKCGIINEATKLTPREDTKKKKHKAHGRKGLYQCNSCREQFTVTIKTIFEDSHIPLNK
jgi:transposase-like zinc ribbon protein